MKKALILISTFLILIASAVSAYAVGAETLAFPEAVGGGKYSPGARGIIDDGGEVEVYHVTNLSASGEGSFADAVSQPGRIIVFDVGGTIELTGTLTIKADNLTILGQTAPGDGITISGGNVVFDDEVKNIIIRYMRIRPTDKNGGEPDGLGGRFNTNIIIDHCSVSWCVDELLTLYAGAAEEGKTVGNHLTIQNTIGSESLRMSNHVKGAHGYGAIWGGTDASYAFNLLAHHDSRSPRLDRQLQSTDVSNNVIYDWGQTNSAYGAEPYSSDESSFEPSNVNWVGNYYKYGPSTRRSLWYRIFDISGPLNDGDPKSRFYFAGNYVFGNEEYTENNILGLENPDQAELLSGEIDMGEYAITRMSAEDAYDYVLQNAGATLPKRDAVDARIVSDVKYGTGRVINNATEVGGLIEQEEEYRTFEIPEDWILNNGLSGLDETDIIQDGEYAGYTLIEAYINEWTAEQSDTPPTNPEIVVKSPAIASVDDVINIGGSDVEVDNGDWEVFFEDEAVRYSAEAFAVGGNAVTKMELYDGNTLIESFDGSSIDTDIYLSEGAHYLTCRAYNTRGEKTQSVTSIVYVKSTDAPGSYSHVQIGSTGYDGLGGAAMDETGVYSIYGSGRITESASDSCDFMYKPVDGDFDITVRAEEIPKFENQQVSGLMVRADLSPSSVMAMIGDGWGRNGENVKVFSRARAGQSSEEIYFKDANGDDCDNGDKSYAMPKYMRIQRSGNTLTFSVSDNGIDWSGNARQPFSIEYDSLPQRLYVGLATDSAEGVSTKEYFSIAKFSRLTLNGESDIEYDDYSVPFHDTNFDGAAWYIPAGDQIIDCSSAPIGGNNGYVLQFWGETSRTFTPQNKGIITASADYYMLGERVVDQTGTRFMLQGQDESGNTVKIASIYAQHDLGFFEEYDEAGNRPSITPDSENKPELKTWYKVVAALDYYTGKGKYSFIPYTEYDSANGVYEFGDSIFDYEFDFDTSVSVSTLHFQRRGGWYMYLSNVSLDIEYNDTTLFESDGRVYAYSPDTDASLYIAGYDENDCLVYSRDFGMDAGAVQTASVPNGAAIAYVKAFLWNDNNSPLIEELTL